jgi:hypothetical protein
LSNGREINPDTAMTESKRYIMGRVRREDAGNRPCKRGGTSETLMSIKRVYWYSEPARDLNKCGGQSCSRAVISTPRER